MTPGFLLGIAVGIALHAVIMEAARRVRLALIRRRMRMTGAERLVYAREMMERSFPGFGEAWDRRAAAEFDDAATHLPHLSPICHCGEDDCPTWRPS